MKTLGLVTVGDKQSAEVGALGCATSGYYGTSTSGEKAERYRTAQAYVGENGIKANTPYKLNDEQVFVEVAK